MKTMITTIQKPSTEMIAAAQHLAERLASPYVARENFSLAKLQRLHALDALVVFTKQGPVIHTAGGEYFFHPSMAELRIKNLQNGNHDHMVKAMNLTAGMSVIDCTLGLGSDATVASFVVGAAGQVQGLESSALLAYIASNGLQQYQDENQALIAAMRRIQVHAVDSYTYLQHQPSQSVDIVYFDPMFRDPIYSSSNIKPFRRLADKRPLSAAHLTEACRVARHRVVFKETADSLEFERLGGRFQRYGGKYSSIAYGVLERGTKAWIE